MNVIMYITGRLRAILLMFSELGLSKTFYYCLSYLPGSIVEALCRIIKSENKAYMRMDSIKWNYVTWSYRDWSMLGEEWNISPQWKQALIDEIMLKYIQPGKTTLEIGPGAGRWTEILQKISKRLIVVDLTDKCIELCKKRFSQDSNIEFFVNDGISLDFISSEIIDFIWSYDVFVHIGREVIEKYLMALSRVLKKGGRGVIHHQRVGGSKFGARSEMTDEVFGLLLNKYGLNPIAQFDSWGDDGRFDVKLCQDGITVFQK